MSHLPELRKSLVRAAARHHRPRARYPRWRSLLHAAPVALAVAVVAAVVAVAVTARGGNPRPSTAGVDRHQAAAVPGRQQMIDILGVLRRPRTEVDRALPRFVVDNPFGSINLTTPDTPLIRYATTTPWGERIYLVPVKPLSGPALAAAERRNPASRQFVARDQARRGETLEEADRSSFGGGATAAGIEAGHMLTTEGAGRSFAGGSTQTKLILVVPDGVARVVFVLPRQSAGAAHGAPVYRRPLSVSVSVHGNVAAVQVDRQCCDGTPPMLWYAADGHLIKRIGNFATVDRVAAPPQPGPRPRSPGPRSATPRRPTASG